MVAAMMLLVTVADVGRADEFEQRYQSISESKGSASETQRLQALFELDWAYTMSVSPETATYVGFPGHETRWTDNSPAAIAERKRLAARPLAVLATIDRGQLSACGSRQLRSV